MTHTHKKASIGAMFRANGMGERCDEGSYIKVCAMSGNDENEREWFLISQGCAENLKAELEALLKENNRESDLSPDQQCPVCGTGNKLCKYHQPAKSIMGE